MGKRAKTLKALRFTGLALVVVGLLIGGFLIYMASPGEMLFYVYTGVGALVFCIGALMYFAYEVFVPEFWKGTWVPGPGHEYPPES